MLTAGACITVLAFILTLFGQRPAAILFILGAAADLTVVFCMQKGGDYYHDKYGAANRWLDTIFVWIAATTIAFFDNWGGLVLFILPVCDLIRSKSENM